MDRYFEHDADVGVIGRGARIEEAFVDAARATFALMTAIEEVAPERKVEFDFEESDVELALVRWLNLLLAHAAVDGVVFGRFALERAGASWHGTAWGEPWRAGLERGIGVKGATLTMLRVGQDAGGWEARCVVDV